MIRIASLFALALLTACQGGTADREQDANNASAAKAPALLPVMIKTASGAHRFDVEVARTPQEQDKGLMFRKAIAAEARVRIEECLRETMGHELRPFDHDVAPIRYSKAKLPPVEPAADHASTDNLPTN